MGKKKLPTVFCGRFGGVFRCALNVFWAGGYVVCFQNFIVWVSTP